MNVKQKCNDMSSQKPSTKNVFYNNTWTIMLYNTNENFINSPKQPHEFTKLSHFCLFTRTHDKYS